MILRDDIAHHRKFLLAGKLIGGLAGPSRALALYVAAIGFARDGLTDGVIPDEFVDKFWLDSRPKSVAKALTSRRVQLFHRIKGGYRIHDFHEYNGDAEKLRQQRELARERQRRHRVKEAVENLLKTEDAEHAVTRDTPRDSRARDLEKEKEKEVRTTSPVRSLSPTCDVPTVVQRPDGRETHAGYTVTKERRDALSRDPATDENYAVLVRLIHNVMDAQGTIDPTSPELLEGVKEAAATKRIQYPHAILHRALRSVAHQRVIGTPPQGGPLKGLADEVRAAMNINTLPGTLRRLGDHRR